MAEDVSGKKLLKVLFLKLFTSDIINAFINIILPISISVKCTSFTNTINWWLQIILICIFIAIYNIISVISKNILNKQSKELNVVYKCYSDQCIINEKFATNIFRLNKTINDSKADGKPINNKRTINKIADFQTLSFTICDSIHNMLVSEYGNEIDCQVTLMQNSSGIIKMVSYSNDNNKMPNSYSKIFNIDNDLDYYFVKLFKDFNCEISCLPNKKSINENFKKISGSEVREGKINQYIGIPIKTNRNEVELLLQIDVSKKNLFGKNKEKMLLFAKNVLYPYATLLHKSYEQDLLFNEYFETILDLWRISNMRIVK